ncbi:uncharacterized protein LOC108197193 isoform X2 [Daucus carota subsp. sativus]|uniref:uncharacterized protein LOC108197193 isoform X2 n=1 Tax=Daucus carota subsp. sativus TaxID=79200 RepID=UPI0007F018FC|nr:PREDICTED: uncharacterized protein LOC108197193 isoform X1 [Daucus carota subsp. sativus]
MINHPHHHPSTAPPLRSHFSLGPLDHDPTAQLIARVRLSDILAYDGVATSSYSKAVQRLSESLTRRNAAIIELNCEDAAVVRCGLEASRLFFRTRSRNGGGGSGVYVYRAGRALEDTDSSPPCMADVFKCMGKAARAALSAVARHLRLRSDVFNYLLDDNPLPANEASSSVLVATYSHAALQNGKGVITGGMLTSNVETEKGLLTLIAADAPGIQVCDPNGQWYLADDGSSPGDLLLLSGRSLSHATAGLRPVTSYRAATDSTLIANSGGRTSLAFRLMPQSNAILDCSPVSAAGHVIPQSYVPISVSQFMDDLSAEENVPCHRTDNANQVASNNLNKEPSLRSILSDPLSGAFLEDAMFVSCGHSFGGMMLRKVIEISKCALCNADIDSGSLIPNHALRAAATAVKYEDDKRLFHNSTLRKRRKEVGNHRENGDVAADYGVQRVIQYPFAVNEKVVIKGNRRTPDKFVGKEAIITSQCLNGWYLLKIIESGENVRLQYRSLRKPIISQSSEDRCPSQPVQNSG